MSSFSGLLAGVSLLAALSAGPCFAAPPPGDPGEFLRHFYAIYNAHMNDRTSDSFPEDHKVCERHCEKGLLKLFRAVARREARTGDEILDADPFCHCQDLAGHYDIVSGRFVGTRYEGTIRNGTERWTVVLTRGGSGWKIYNIVDPQFDLRDFLAKNQR